MTPEIITTLVAVSGFAITILGANWAMFHSLRGEMRNGFRAVDDEFKLVRTEMHDGFKAVDDEFKLVRTEMHDGFKAVDDEFKSVRTDMGKLNERMARVEGMIDGLREAIAARAVA